jgi:hypothetical protein
MAWAMLDCLGAGGSNQDSPIASEAPRPRLEIESEWFITGKKRRDKQA